MTGRRIGWLQDTFRLLWCSEGACTNCIFLFSLFLTLWYLRPCWLRRNCLSQGSPILTDKKQLARSMLFIWIQPIQSPYLLYLSFTQRQYSPVLNHPKDRNWKIRDHLGLSRACQNYLNYPILFKPACPTLPIPSHRKHNKGQDPRFPLTPLPPNQPGDSLSGPSWLWHSASA